MVPVSKSFVRVDGHLLAIDSKVVLLTPPKPIYGVKWVGTSTTALTRTDSAADFADPSPAVNVQTGSSPFDDIYPWSGMVRVTDDIAGELVAIPKFYYKWTKRGYSLGLQISEARFAGSYVSPAHADRGDGSGERDVVYVGRYHCTSTYKSATYSAPKNSITRSSARTAIHSLGSSYWQFDYAMRLTIQMLYLVEFADWDSRAKIGRGCLDMVTTGMTDTMRYHTGTIAESSAKYGATQYRHIEGLWDNAFDWMDGCYYSNDGMSIILNPNNFNDSANGIVIGTPLGGYINEFGIVEASGVQWIYPTAAGKYVEGYVTDEWEFNSSEPCLFSGGYLGNNEDYGLFCVGCTDVLGASNTVGCRLQKLP